MLPRRIRLSTEQLVAVIEKGRIIHSSFFLMRTLSSADRSRISAVAPKKFARTAVARNKLRRQIYAMVAPLYPLLTKNSHSALFAKPEIMKAERTAIAADLKALFVKAGLLK